MRALILALMLMSDSDREWVQSHMHAYIGGQYGTADDPCEELGVTRCIERALKGATHQDWLAAFDLLEGRSPKTGTGKATG